MRERIARRKFFVSRAVRACCFSVAFVSVVTFLMGAFVAGLGAGGIHNDWPLMSGSFVPSDYALLEPWWRNALENPSAVQFEHRFLALLLLLGCFVLFVFLRQSSVRMDWHARGLLFLPTACWETHRATMFWGGVWMTLFLFRPSRRRP